MLTNTKKIVAAALVAGTASMATATVALASDNSGEYHGGFVVPGDPAVNPAYHPGWFGYRSAGRAYGNAGQTYGYVPPVTREPTIRHHSRTQDR
jgi:hypothetical protein